MENNIENIDESLSESVKILSPTRLLVKRFFRSKLSWFGLITLIILFLFSFVGPLFNGQSDKGPIWGETETDVVNLHGEYFYQKVNVEVDGVVYEMYIENYNVPKRNIYGSPSKDHWLGTDQNGNDVFTRLMYGGRISLTLGFVVVILETLIGVFFGALAGYFGGWIDQLIMRIVDIFMCVPTFPILLIVCAVLDAYNIESILRMYLVMVALTIFGWSGTARLVRGQILMFREQEFMLAAETLGLSTGRKIFKHLIPNVMPQLIVSMTLGLGGIILTEASLSYLGLGLSYPAAAWGSMISIVQNNNEILNYYFNIWGPAGICIVLAILAFNFIGDGLRDALDPKTNR